MKICFPIKWLFRTTLCVAFTAFYCHGFAQNNTDSFPLKTHHFSLDSTLIQGKISSKKKETKTAFYSSLSRFKEKIGSIKKNKEQLVDSSQKRAYINKVNTLKEKYTIHKPDSSNLDSLKKSLASKLKSSGFIPSLEGSILSESYATNFLDPFTRSEAVYTRLYGSPSITMLGLPFTVDFYYTTEDNSFYNSNYISLDFDINTYKNQLRAKAEKKIQDKIAEKKNGIKNLTDVTKAQQLLATKLAAEKAKLQELKNNIPDGHRIPQYSTLDSIKTQAIDRAKSTVSDSLSTIKKGALTKAEQQKKTLLDSAQGTLDSSQTTQQYLAYKDSIAKIQLRIDTLEEQYTQAKEHYEKLKSINDNLQDSIASLKSAYASKDFAMHALKKTKHGKKIAAFIANIDRFQLGLTNPIFSKYTLNGIPVKGLNTQFHTKNKEFSVVAGRTFTNSFNSFDAQRAQEFDRHVFGFSSKIKLGKSGSKKITLSNVNFLDPLTKPIAMQNVLTSVDFESTFLKIVDFHVSVNHSHYDEIRKDAYSVRVEDENVAVNPTSLQKTLDQLAVEVNTGIELGKHVDLSLNYTRINPAYISLGNPFLRYNFHEGEIKAKTKLFKRKVTLTSFYKHFEDNITHLTETTNILSGYGVSFRTNFRKGLNFQGQYSPYQQGNNNPDTLFRTDNQLSVKTLTAVYNKSLKKVSLVSLITYVNSTVNYNQGEVTIDNSLYLGSFSVNWKKLNLTSSLSRNLTGPTIDTLNYWGIRVAAMQTGGKSVNFAVNSFYDGFDAGPVRHRTTLQARFSLLKKLEATISGEYGQVKGLYGIEEKNVFGCRLLMKYTL